MVKTVGKSQPIQSSDRDPCHVTEVVQRVLAAHRRRRAAAAAARSRRNGRPARHPLGQPALPLPLDDVPGVLQPAAARCYGSATTRAAPSARSGPMGPRGERLRPRSIV